MTYDGMPRYSTYTGYKRNRRRHERWAARYERDKARERNKTKLGPRMRLVGISWLLSTIAIASSHPWLGITGFVLGPLVFGLVGRRRRLGHDIVEPARRPSPARIDDSELVELIFDFLSATELVPDDQLELARDRAKKTGSFASALAPNADS